MEIWLWRDNQISSVILTEDIYIKLRRLQLSLRDSNVVSHTGFVRRYDRLWIAYITSFIAPHYLPILVRIANPHIAYIWL